MIENYGAWHNLPYATKQNGFGGTDIELKFNDEPRIKLIQMMAGWTKDKTLVYGGRENKSDPLFNGGDCAFRIGSSGSSAGAEKALGADKVGVNSAALARPELITELAERLGSQAVVVAIDAQGGRVRSHAGTLSGATWASAPMTALAMR